MGRWKKLVPDYRLHKPTGLAVVTIDGCDRYLGQYDSPESKAEYRRLVRKLKKIPSLTIAEILVEYRFYTEKHCRGSNGEITRDLEKIRDSCRLLREKCGSMLAHEFSPEDLVELRDAIVSLGGLSRTAINTRINMIKDVFNWAVRGRLIFSEVALRLGRVKPLVRGKTEIDVFVTDRVDNALNTEILPGYTQKLFDFDRLVPPSICDVEGLSCLPREWFDSGIYFLCLNDEVVYVGQSTCVSLRIGSHIQEKTKDFDYSRIFFLPAPAKQLYQLELYYIRLLKPRYNGNRNGTGCKHGTTESVEEIIERLKGKSWEDISRRLHD